MALASGAKLGPYEVVSPLGAGGMGEVYRARDARLGRDVAVKVLPAAFSRDPERLRRFEQEARATAALNHPNILAVFDIGTEDESTGHRQLWKELNPPDSAGINFIRTPHISADGKVYAYNYNRILSSLYLVDGLK